MAGGVIRIANKDSTPSRHSDSTGWSCSRDRDVSWPHSPSSPRLLRPDHSPGPAIPQWNGGRSPVDPDVVSGGLGMHLLPHCYSSSDRRRAEPEQDSANTQFSPPCGQAPTMRSRSCRAGATSGARSQYSHLPGNGSTFSRRARTTVLFETPSRVAHRDPSAPQGTTGSGRPSSNSDTPGPSQSVGCSSWRSRSPGDDRHRSTR